MPSERDEAEIADQVADQQKSRGFASMEPSKQKEIASRGGKAAHAQGRAHEFTADEARAAGRKGGQAVSRNREHMAMIGRQGGKQRGENLRLAREKNEQREQHEPRVETVTSTLVE